ncbi:MAG: hypothetical protein H0U70_09110 [Tatlockia sp.]|nr:hypothetical protein [Tatlockia sp.]
MPKNQSTNVESSIEEFGLQNATQVLTFLKTKISKELLAEIEGYLTDKKELDQRILQHTLQNEREEQALLLEELEKEEETQEFIIKATALEILKQQAQKKLESSESSQEPATSANAGFDKTLDIALKDLEKTEETYSNYSKNLDEADLFVKDLDPKDEKTAEILVKRIEAIEQEIHEEAPKISELLSSGQDLKARELLNDLNAKNLQLALLKDLHAVCTGKKNMYTKDGKTANNFNEAFFIVHEDQKIHYDKDSAKYYLLNKNENFDDLSQNDKAIRNDDFKDKEFQISRVRTVVEHNRGLDLGEKIQKIWSLSCTIVQAAVQAQSPTIKFSGMVVSTSSGLAGASANLAPDKISKDVDNSSVQEPTLPSTPKPR